MNFSIEVACLSEFSPVFFVRTIAGKLLNFSPEVMICWTLKM